MKTKLNITPENFTRLDNDVNGNPKYYISIADFLSVAPDDMGLLEKCDYIDKKRKGSILNKYRGKKYGSGYTIQSYSLPNSCRYINDFFNK